MQSLPLVCSELSYIEKWERERERECSPSFLPSLCLGNPLSREGGKERRRPLFDQKLSAHFVSILCVAGWQKENISSNSSRSHFPTLKAVSPKEEREGKKERGKKNEGKDVCEKEGEIKCVDKQNSEEKLLPYFNCTLFLFVMTVECRKWAHFSHCFGFYNSFSVESSVQISPPLLLTDSWQFGPPPPFSRDFLFSPKEREKINSF